MVGKEKLKSIIVPFRSSLVKCGQMEVSHKMMSKYCLFAFPGAVFVCIYSQIWVFPWCEAVKEESVYVQFLLLGRRVHKLVHSQIGIF